MAFTKSIHGIAKKLHKMSWKKTHGSKQRNYFLIIVQFFPAKILCTMMKKMTKRTQCINKRGRVPSVNNRRGKGQPCR